MNVAVFVFFIQYDRGFATPVILVLASQRQKYSVAAHRSKVEKAVVSPAPSDGIVAAGVQCFHVVMSNLRHVNFPAGQILQRMDKFFGRKKQVFSFVLIDKDAVRRFFLV